MKTPVPAKLSGFDVVIFDISESGCQLQHEEPLKLGSSSQLFLQNPATGDQMVFPGRVIWSRLSGELGTSSHAYHSALKFGELDSVTHTALAKFVTRYGEYDRSSLKKKLEALGRKSEDRRNAVAIYKNRDEIPSDVLLKIMEAREFLQMNALTGQKWYQRARFTKQAAKGNGKAQYCDEVLAVWELLGHKYPVNVVALALNLS